MTATMSADPRSATNPLFNSNRLRLGVFAIITGGAVSCLLAFAVPGSESSGVSL